MDKPEWILYQPDKPEDDLINTEMTYPDNVITLVEVCMQAYSQARWIDLSEFNDRDQSESWVIVDARAEEEISVSTIPGAITLEALCADLKAYRNTSILVYCTIGCRSGNVAESLMADGFRTYNLWGGVIAWALHGNSFITSGGEETYQVHVFDEKWNVIPPPYETVW